ncbi:ESPR-type extended signal peptide-containing protein, partial [Burkholderia sp. DN3021]
MSLGNKAMNQQAYKIKFSRRAGTWVAVSELTRG